MHVWADVTVVELSHHHTHLPVYSTAPHVAWHGARVVVVVKRDGARGAARGGRQMTSVGGGEDVCLLPGLCLCLYACICSPADICLKNKKKTILSSLPAYTRKQEKGDLEKTTCGPGGPSQPAHGSEETWPVALYEGIWRRKEEWRQAWERQNSFLQLFLLMPVFSEQDWRRKEGKPTMPVWSPTSYIYVFYIRTLEKPLEKAKWKIRKSGESEKDSLLLSSELGLDLGKEERRRKQLYVMYVCLLDFSLLYVSLYALVPEKRTCREGGAGKNEKYVWEGKFVGGSYCRLLWEKGRTLKNEEKADYRKEKGKEGRKTKKKKRKGKRRDMWKLGKEKT